jgi:hypothetical protein
MKTAIGIVAGLAAGSAATHRDVVDFLVVQKKLSATRRASWSVWPGTLR